MPAQRPPRRRREVVYMALQRVRSREIITLVGSRKYLEYGDDNGLLKELAGIIDAALQAELERRRGRT